MSVAASALPKVSDAPGRVIWVISDGKPGHVNQSMGLAEALLRANVGSGSIEILPALPWWRASLAWLLKRSLYQTLPAPDLIVGAGHATHLSMLAVRRAQGGRAVVLMKPSLPRRCFDLCILVHHDNVVGDARTLVTEGPLNRMRVSKVRNTTRGLLLIGGNSSHYEWCNATVHSQIQSILERSPHIQWTITTSRRTPPDFMAGLAPAPGLQIVPYTLTSPDWIGAQLAQSAIVWVTPDSTSMVYEALTAGATVGVFDLPGQPQSRAVRTITHLAQIHCITRFNGWMAHGRLHPNVHPLAEADRCAHWIMAWFKQKN